MLAETEKNDGWAIEITYHEVVLAAPAPEYRALTTKEANDAPNT